MTIEFGTGSSRGGGLTLAGSSAQFPFAHITTYPATTAPSTVFRFALEATEELVVHRLQIERADGAAPSSITFDIYDVTSGTTIASTTDTAVGTAETPLGVSEPGVTVEGRLDNNTGANADLSLVPVMQIRTSE